MSTKHILNSNAIIDDLTQEIELSEPMDPAEFQDGVINKTIIVPLAGMGDGEVDNNIVYRVDNDGSQVEIGEVIGQGYEGVNIDGYSFGGDNEEDFEDDFEDEVEED